MGIKGLSGLIADTCPQAISEDELKNMFARTIAFDANMSMYQFLISIRGSHGGDLTNMNGEVTSHLQGLLNRTIKFLELGIKPIYVFDGKPPEMKSSELQKRREKVKEAEEKFSVAEQEGDEEKMLMYSKRTVRVSREQVEDGKKLLRLMGVPVIESPTEAESQCAELAKKKLVYATGTEDMDALTFGTPTLVRHMTFSEARKQPIQTFDLKTVLDAWQVTMDQFIDICILCGCDYCDTIRGIGPKKAHQMIKKYGDIERVVKSLKDKPQYVVPSNFLEDVTRARELFKNPDVTDASELEDKLKWVEPDEEGLVDFLVKEKAFDEARVRASVKKLLTNKGKAQQERLTSFFTVVKKGRGKIEKEDKNKKKGALGKRGRGESSSSSSKKKK